MKDLCTYETALQSLLFCEILASNKLSLFSSDIVNENVLIINFKPRRTLMSLRQVLKPPQQQTWVHMGVPCLR